nr:MAG TPA: hypothetical protein [Caudoviricetes sp.]
MRPCAGVEEVCPALCSWKDLTDGTYSITDVERFNQTLFDLVREHNRKVEASSAN